MATIRAKNKAGEWEVVSEATAIDKEFEDSIAYLEGKQAAYNAFWDAYQENGERSGYEGGFAGRGWNKDTFKPKYKLIPKGQMGGRHMFYTFNRKTYSATEEDLLDFTNIDYDFSGITHFISTFEDALIKNLYVDASNAVNMTNAFMAGNGGRIENLTLKVSEKCTTFSNCFTYQRSIKEIHFTEDSVIATNISFSTSTKLSKESIVSILRALSTTVSGKTLTLSKTAVNSAFETAEGAKDGSSSNEWITLLAPVANWIITLS